MQQKKVSMNPKNSNTMIVNFIIAALVIALGIFLIIYTRRNPSGDFVFEDLKVYALGVGCIICGIIYILDKLKIV